MEKPNNLSQHSPPSTEGQEPSSYDDSEPKSRFITLFILTTAAIIAVVLLGTYSLYRNMASDTLKNLQKEAPMHGREFRSQQMREAKELHSAPSFDKETGRYRIPIGEAMKQTINDYEARSRTILEAPK